MNMSDERTVNRKAKTESQPNVDPEDLPEDDPEGIQIDKTFDGIKDAGARLRGILPGFPTVGTHAAVLSVLYTLTVVGALSVAFGATSLTASYGGTYAALIVGGLFAFVYGFVALTAFSRVGASK